MSRRKENVTNTELASFENRDSVLQARREFLVKSGLGMAGFALLSSPIVKAATPTNAQWPWFLRLLGSFAKNVGFTLAALAIYDAWKSRSGNNDYFANQYSETARKGYYYDPRWKYYGPQTYRGSRETGDEDFAGQGLRKAAFRHDFFASQETSYVFYPWVWQDNFNGLGQFHHWAGDRYFTGRLAAPTVYGLGLAANDLLTKGICRSPEEVSQTLLPYCQNQESLGKFELNYRAPDKYCSLNQRTVSVDYEALRQDSQGGEGRIRVIGTEDLLTGEKKFFDKKYDVAFSYA
jgi:hypothetical protein